MADEPTILFRIATGGPIGEGLGGYGTRTLLVPSGDNNLYAVDLFTAQGTLDLSLGGADRDRSRWSPTRMSTSSTRPATFPAARPHDRRAAMDHLHPGGSPRGGHRRPRCISDRTTSTCSSSIAPRAGSWSDPSETHLRAGLNLREYDLDIVNRFNDRMYFAHPFGPDPLRCARSGCRSRGCCATRSNCRSATSRRRASSDTPPTAPAAEPATTPEAGQEPAADANAPAPAADKEPATEEGRREGAGVTEAPARSA